jgi:hypothetical protein
MPDQENRSRGWRQQLFELRLARFDRKPYQATPIEREQIEGAEHHRVAALIPAAAFGAFLESVEVAAPEFVEHANFAIEDVGATW